MLRIIIHFDFLLIQPLFNQVNSSEIKHVCFKDDLAGRAAG